MKITNKKLIYGLCIFLVLLIIGVVGFRFWGSSVDTPSISIPSPSPDSSVDGAGEDANRLEVSADTVQELLSTLEPLDVYCRGCQLFTYWEGGEAEARISIWKDGDRFRVFHSQNNVGRNTMLLDGQLHYWYEGSKQVFTVPVSGDGDALLDDYARLISLDELMSLPKEDIIDAGYEEKCGENCIFVEYRSGDDRLCRLYVSVDKGLLIAGEITEGGKIIYLLESVFTDEKAPGEDIFKLP